MTLYRIVVWINRGLSNRFADYMFSDNIRPPVGKHTFHLACYWLSRLEVLLYDWQHPCEVPF